MAGERKRASTDQPMHDLGLAAGSFLLEATAQATSSPASASRSRSSCSGPLRATRAARRVISSRSWISRDSKRSSCRGSTGGSTASAISGPSAAWCSSSRVTSADCIAGTMPRSCASGIKRSKTWEARWS